MDSRLACLFMMLLAGATKSLGDRRNRKSVSNSNATYLPQSDSACTIQFDSSFSADSFPSGFTFGTATSAYQTEGAALQYGRGPSIWDKFVSMPGKVLNGDNASVADDSYHKYPEDIALMKAMGVTAYRFSISWSRILPKGTGEINPLGIEFYNNLIDALLESKITPKVTLYHWDLPEALHESMGGWLNSSIVNYYVEFVNVVFQTYGDRVKTWVTFNEPMEVSVQGYSLGQMAPGRCSNRSLCAEGNSSTEPYIVGHNILLSHAAAVQLYREQYQGDQGGRIGITLDSQFYFPAEDTEADKEASDTALQFSYGWFADPVIYGDYPAIIRDHVGSRLPQFTSQEKSLLKGSVDFLAINCYTGSYVSSGSPPPPGTGYPWTDSWTNSSSSDSNGVPIGEPSASSFLLVVPEALYSLVMWVHDRYSEIPILVTENGTSDPGNATLTDVLCDQHRIQFYQSYLKGLLRAIEEGANVQAFFVWSLLDNFEWEKGYSERYGIHYVDFEDPERPRYPKLSALWWSYFLHTPRVVEGR